MATLFERLSRNRPAEAVIEQPSQEPAQKLLTWLQTWDQPTITARDIRNFGPRPRDRETAIRSAQILVANGFLSPVNSHTWQIVRQPLVPTDSQ